MKRLHLPELDKTLAQMSPAEKNAIGARGRALQDLRGFLVAQ